MKAAVTLTIADILRATGGSLRAGSKETVVETVSSDSRDLGEAALFLPLKGERFDGHSFLAELIHEKKIAAALTMDDGFDEAARQGGVALIRCDDTLAALGRLGAWYRSRFNVKLMGITGTNGKTTTKELLHTVLASRFDAFKNEKNYNNEIGVPFSLLTLREGHETGVVEMGMNHPGEIERLSKIVRPDSALITGIGEGHLEFLGSLEGVAEAKSEIVAGMEPGSLLLVNGETPCLDIVIKRAGERNVAVKTFGLLDRFDYFPEGYRLTPEGIFLTWGGSEIFVPLYGIHNVYNVMAVIAAASETGMMPDEIKKSLGEVNNVDGRSQIIDMGVIVINDTYNSNPLSSRFALRSVSEIFPERKKFAVLADMKELGETAPQCHRDIGAEAARRDFDFLYCWGDMGRFYIQGAESESSSMEALCFETKQELISHLKENAAPGDVLLVKGSRSTRMEEVVEALRKGASN